MLTLTKHVTDCQGREYCRVLSYLKTSFGGSGMMNLLLIDPERFPAGRASLVPAKQSARFEYPTRSVIVLQRLLSGGGQLSTKEYGVVVVIYPACIVSTFFLKSLGQQRRARPHAVTSWRKMAAHWRAAIEID